MRQITDTDYSWLFKVAALYNVLAAVFYLVFPELGAKLMFKNSAVAIYPAIIFYNFTWVAVLLFGIGYYIVSLDVNKNHGIVVIGILGKLFFFFYFLYLYFQSQCTLLAVAGGIGDLLFVILFAWFLYKKRIEKRP